MATQMTRSIPPLLVLLAGASVLANAQGPAPQTEADAYTRYELLAPETGKFRILYEVTATTPGARYYFNPIRKGSVASDEAVFDRFSGAAVPFEIVGGSVAKAGGVSDAGDDEQYIRVALPRPVPADGEVRLLIEKTYADPKSYSANGDRITFTRSLGVKRNAVVLPAGYELLGCSYPSQVVTEADGRIRVSFMNTGPDAVSFVVEARRLPRSPEARPQARSPEARPPDARAEGPTVAPTVAPAVAATAPIPSASDRLDERARQDREIVYFLNPPETHSFDLYHDYTETREGTDKYLNVVRAGSKASNPSARILDTGEALKVETLRGDEIAKAKLDIEEPIRPESEVVVIRFPPVKKGTSARLRISETYTDPARYRVEGDGIVFDRTLGRPRNAVVLPRGYALTASSIPAVVTQTDDGRIRLDLDNARTDEIAVLIKAVRRPAPAK
jgi:hypothetical protein